MFVQLFTVAMTLCHASSEVSISSSGLDIEAAQSFWSWLGVDQALQDAFAEGIFALTFFGLFSVLLAVYTKHKNKKQGPIKAKRFSQQDNPSQVSKKKLERVQESELDALVSAVRVGKASKLPELLDAALQRSLTAAAHAGTPDSEAIASQLLLSALRACASTRCFCEAIVAYEHMAGRIGEGNANLWSVLLFHVVEAGKFHVVGAGAYRHGKYVLEQLQKQGGPNPPSHDFVNMVRCYAGHAGHKESPMQLRKSLQNLRSSGHFVDKHTWNRALAACGSGSSPCVLELAEELLCAGICNEDIDVVGYNTLMKLNARAGRISRCFELRTEMSSKGIAPSEVTFGILLDACVCSKELDRARGVFSDLCLSGLQLNVVHCSSFIKVLVNAGLLDEAAAVLSEMIRSPGGKPDLLMFSIMVKAYSDNGDVSSALKMLELMMKEGIEPDEVFFNSVLSGCSTFPLKMTEVTRTFELLMGRGMKPTTTTLSILLKSLANTGAWAASLQVLKDAPKRFRFAPEPRLYIQVAQACSRADEGKTIATVFKAMLESWRQRGWVGAHKEAVRLCLRACLMGGAPDVVKELREIMEESGITIDAQVDEMFKSTYADIAAGKYKGGSFPFEERPVCRHFQLGRCERGHGCRFSHEVSSGA